MTQASVPAAPRHLDAVLDRVAGEYARLLAPAIDRVWRDEIATLAATWHLGPEAGRRRRWTPEYFEFSFGSDDEGRDPRSLKDPVLVDGRFLLHGRSI